MLKSVGMSLRDLMPHPTGGFGRPTPFLRGAKSSGRVEAIAFLLLGATGAAASSRAFARDSSQRQTQFFFRNILRQA
jgi:hypothetical protein